MAPNPQAGNTIEIDFETSNLTPNELERVERLQAKAERAFDAWYAGEISADTCNEVRFMAFQLIEQIVGKGKVKPAPTVTPEKRAALEGAAYEEAKKAAHARVAMEEADQVLSVQASTPEKEAATPEVVEHVISSQEAAPQIEQKTENFLQSKTRSASGRQE